MAIALVGFCLGLAFRLKVLLPFLAILLIGTAGFSAFRGYSVFHAATTVILAQFIIQGGYFVGLLARWLWSGDNRNTRLI